jgi:hypothetical protein
VGAPLRRHSSRFAILIAVGCAPTSVDLPPVPARLATVAAEYDLPTGTVPARAAAALAELQQKSAVIAESHLPEIFTDALVLLRTRLRRGGLPVDLAASDRPPYNAYARIDQTCRGWDERSTVPDPVANGRIELTAEVRATQIERTIWGSAAACRGRVDIADAASVHAYLDGTLGVYLFGPLPRRASEARFLVQLQGTLGTEQRQAPADLDFRVLYPQVEVRVAVPDGHVIGVVSGGGVTLRDSNGVFDCSLETDTCTPFTM